MNAVIKGAKAGEGKARKAVIAPDSAQSKTYIKILYGLSEGEVEGLANGLQSVYLEETPLQNPAGGWNFEDVQADFRHGTNDQTHIEGFPDISSETAINVELKSDSPWVRSLTNTDLDAIRLRFKWGPLREQNAENGDVKGIVIQYAIDLQTDGGTWTEVLNTQIADKTSANYERSHRIDLPKADTGWTIRVRRITPNSTSEYISDKMYVDALTEVIDLKLSYPNTALLGLQYDAETFSNVAKVAVDLKGIKLQVPSNYDPVARTYSGMWDGTFKRAYTNNPAWIYYDICTAKRYALGDRLTSAMLDKWSLYRLAQYCDQMIDDGKGGQEPRFTCNVYLQSTEDAYVILSKLAGVFRAISYWDGNSIVCDADIPQDTYFTYTRANVIDGMFEYSGTRARDRHTVAKVAWDNPANHYKTEYVYVRDEAAIAKLGVRMAEIDAWGCTSEGQAQRAGLWALKSEQLETRTVSFKVGLDGYIPQPGRVIEIADELFAGRANGGRISKVSANLRTITLDRDDVVCRAGDRLVVNGEDGKSQARIVSSVNGRNITVTTAFDSVAPENIWAVDAQDLKTMKFRVMSITQDDKHQFSITGLQYESAKYDAIDFGAFIDERPISIINPTVQAPVESVSISSESMVQQGLSVETMIIAWPQAQGATKYQVEWRKDDGSWIKLPITGSNSVEVQGIYSGNYEARVTAISAFDIASLPTYSMLTALTGKTGLPPALANLSATGILFGYRLNWNFPAVGALDAAYTEIEISSTTNGANAAQLGLFAYPTDTHELQGMQPNLTRWFRGRLIDRIGNIGPWSARVSATTSADASAVLDLLSNKITESQLHQDLQTKIDKIDTIAGLDGDIGNLIDNITAVQTQADQLNTALNQETQQRISAVQDLDDGLTQEIVDRQSAITQEITNRNTAIASEATARNTAILQEANARSTAILTEKNERISADSNLSSRIDTVSASSGNNAAAIQQEAEARASADSAISNRIDSVLAEVNENTAAINQEAIARADADSANASLIETVRAESNQNSQDLRALVVDESNARIDADRVLAERVTGVEVITNPDMIGSTDDLIGSESGNAGVWSILSAVQEGDLFQAQRTDLLTVSVNNNAANILTEQTARVSADDALSERIDSLNVEFNGNTASINQKLQSLADADQALASDISGMNARVGDNEANIISESEARADGDTANAQALTDYRSINDTALANVRQAAESAVTATSANTQAVQALDSRIVVAEGNANTAKTNAATALTKAETATTQAGSAASLATQASAIANQASNTADTANQTAATALSTANVAATQSGANATRLDAITLELGDKASTGALSQTDAKVAEHEGKISANTTKIDGVYAQVNPKLIGSTEDLIGSTGLAGTWTLQSAVIENDMALSQRIDTTVAEIDNAKALVQTEAYARAQENEALSSRINTLKVDVDGNKAAIVTLETARATDNESFAGRFDTLQASTKTAKDTADQAVQDAQLKSAAAEAAAKTYADAKAKAEADAAIAAASDDATAKANAAESAAKAAAALDAKNKADAAKQAAIDAAALDATAKANAAEAAAKEVANAAQQAASAAATAADNKGEVIFGSTTPAADKRLSQNLWIDTTGGLNTPKRWNGSAWVTVTDKAATDAAAAAKAAQDTATEALNKADTATENIATIKLEQGVFTDRLDAIGGEIKTIQGYVGGQQTSIEVVSAVGDLNKLKNEIAKARLDEDITKLQGQAAALTSAVNSYDARIAEITSKRTQEAAKPDKNQELIDLYTSQIAELNAAKIDANAQKAAIASQVAQITADKARLNSLVLTESKIKAQHTIKLDSGGVISSYGLAIEESGGTNYSNFVIRANSFALAGPASAGSTPYYPFIFRNTPFTDPVTGTVFPVSAYLKSAMMDYQSVKTSHIEDLAVKTAKIDNAAITTAKIGDLQVDTLKIKDEAVTVPTSVKSTSEFTVSGAYDPTSDDYNAQLTKWEAKFGNLLSVTVNRSGGKCRIDASCIAFRHEYLTAYATDGGTLSYQERLNLRAVVSVYRNGTLVARQETPPSDVIGTGSFYFTGIFAINAGIEDAFAGQANYVLKLGFANRNTRPMRVVINHAQGAFSVQNPQMILTEMKK